MFFGYQKGRKCITLQALHSMLGWRGLHLQSPARWGTRTGRWPCRCRAKAIATELACQCHCAGLHPLSAERPRSDHRPALKPSIFHAVDGRYFHFAPPKKPWNAENPLQIPTDNGFPMVSRWCTYIYIYIYVCVSVYLCICVCVCAAIGRSPFRRSAMFPCEDRSIEFWFNIFDLDAGASEVTTPEKADQV